GCETDAAVQFDHRMLAYASVLMVGWLWLAVRRASVTPRARFAANAMAAMVVAQVLLGIATLLLVVPLPLAVLHQLGAATLFSLTLWTVYELTG
ncbi:MAG: COX15/CtaA family protein, partial [Rhodospirillaceae bacterium]|nr:COX15/CtaA family protein [Rhodospirillaceae bacterium]